MTSYSSQIKNISLMQWLILLVGGVAIFQVLLINWQPWLSAGYDLATFIVRIPFLGFLMDAQFGIGWFFTGLFSKLGDVTGLTLWIVCTLIQSLPIAFAITGHEMSQDVWMIYGGSYLVEIAVNFAYYPPYGDGIPDFVADFFRWDWYLIEWHQLGMMLLSILVFEGLLAIFATLYFAAKSRNRRGGQR